VDDSLSTSHDVLGSRRLLGFVDGVQTYARIFDVHFGRDIAPGPPADVDGTRCS
jgi:hypothetical protein